MVAKEKRSDFGFGDKFLFGTSKGSIAGPAKKRRKGKRKKKK